MIKWGVKRNQGKYLKSPKRVYSLSGNSKDKQQKQSLKNGSSPNSFFRRLFMKCLLWKAFTLVYIPNLWNRRHCRKRNQIIDLLKIQLQPVKHRLQPGWELHCHHHRHHRYHRQHLHRIRPLE